MIPGLLFIGLVIYIHELGHFIVSKLCKVDVDVLSYGIGPKVLSVRYKHTEFRLSAIPFGGYCRMKGSVDLTRALEKNAKTISITEKGSFFSVSPYLRFLIYLSGPLTNFILTFLLILLSASIPVEHLSNEAIITPVSEYIEVFNSEIKQENIRKGDIIITLDGKDIKDWEDAERILISKKGKELPVTVYRDGDLVYTKLVPQRDDSGYSYGVTNIQKPIIARSECSELLAGDTIIKANGKDIENTLDLYSLGTTNLDLVVLRDGNEVSVKLDYPYLPFAWYSSFRKYSQGGNIFSYAIKQTITLSKTTLKAFGALFTFNFKEARKVISSPTQVASSFTNISSLALKTSINSGIRTLFYLLAIVSISVCIGNILPIPTFDGGQMLICVFEMIKGRPLHPKSYLVLQLSGMIISWIIVSVMYFIL